MWCRITELTMEFIKWLVEAGHTSLLVTWQSHIKTQKNPNLCDFLVLICAIYNYHLSLWNGTKSQSAKRNFCKSELQETNEVFVAVS